MAGILDRSFAVITLYPIRNIHRPGPKVMVEDGMDEGQQKENQRWKDHLGKDKNCTVVLRDGKEPMNARRRSRPHFEGKLWSSNSTHDQEISPYEKRLLQAKKSASIALIFWAYWCGHNTISLRFCNIKNTTHSANWNNHRVRATFLYKLLHHC
jgi:hypothetical protein